MGVFSDDFAAVDFGEELCQTQPPEKANSKRSLYILRHSLPLIIRVSIKTCDSYKKVERLQIDLSRHAHAAGDKIALLAPHIRFDI